jgi:transposase
MSTTNFFARSAVASAPSSDSSTAPEMSGAPRLETADRKQVQLRPYDLDAVLPANHRARAFWAVVEKLDLSLFYAVIAARGSEPGRPAIDPKVLVALWLYATSEGVGSARELARLCEAHDAYRWICGGVSVNHHTLSDFRVEHGAALDDLMTQVLAVLMRQGIVKIHRVAQDGMRVRAAAGAASFRREKSLKACLETARQHVERVKREAERSEIGRTARERAAAERAAREREERVARALAELPKAREAKHTAEAKEQARVSTTDAEARVMKMGDGGYRPAYNVQVATDTESRVIVGVGVNNAGTDAGNGEPMLADIERRTGEFPKEHLIDGGFVNLESFEKAAARGVTSFAPVPKPRVEGIDPHKPKPGDSEAVAAWRERMGTDAAKEIYKERAATAETVNADLRTWRGLDRFAVRGSAKVSTIVLWSAITYNIMRWIAAGVGT